MKKYVSLILVGILSISLIGCSLFDSCYVDQDKTPQKTELGDVNIDRHDLVIGGNTIEQNYDNQYVKAFVSKYNKHQSNSNLRINSDYKVTYDSFSKAYHIISDNVNLSVHFKDNGDMLFAGVAGDANLPIEQEIEVAMAIFKIASENGNVPAEVVSYMKDVKSRAEDLNAQATEAYERIDQAIQNLDTEGFLDEIRNSQDIPEVDLEPESLPTLPPEDEISVDPSPDANN